MARTQPFPAPPWLLGLFPGLLPERSPSHRCKRNLWWFTWVLFKHTLIAAYRGSEALTSLCVTSYLIIPSLFLLVNRFQICNGFDACIIPYGSSKPGLHPLGELVGRDGEYAACSPLILLPVAMNTRLFSCFLFSFYIFVINDIFCHSKSCLIVIPAVSPIPLWHGGNV